MRGPSNEDDNLWSESIFTDYVYQPRLITVILSLFYSQALALACRTPVDLGTSDRIERM